MIDEIWSNFLHLVPRKISYSHDRRCDTFLISGFKYFSCPNKATLRRNY